MWSVFITELDALRGSAVVLQARAKADKKNLVRTYHNALPVCKCRGYSLCPYNLLIRIKI